MTKIEQIKSLVESFYSDNGVPHSVYTVTRQLILEVYGENKVKEFTSSVDATDGCFYIDPKSSFKID